MLLDLFPLLFIAVTAAPAGLFGKYLTPRSLPREFLTFSLIVIITTAIAVVPETFSVLHFWMGSPTNLDLLVQLAMFQLQAMVAAIIFAGAGWIMATIVQGVFED